MCLPQAGRSGPGRWFVGTLGGVGSFKLTIRNGPKVTREKHDSLEAAIAALRSHTERIKAEGDLPEVSMIRRPVSIGVTFVAVAHDLASSRVAFQNVSRSAGA